MSEQKQRCARCRKTKPVGAFSPRKSGKRNALCKPCRVDYQREWLKKKKNKEAHERRVEERKQRLKALVDEFKTRPCSDCGEMFPPYVMECDHVRGTKIDDICRLVRRANKPLLLAELEKCEVVCTNCHLIRTQAQREAKE